TDDDLDFDLEDDMKMDDIMGSGNGYDTNDLRRKVSMMAGAMFEEKREKTMEEFVHRLSQFSGPSNHRK
ncbi:hypothetical protein CEJ83_20190, partial [Acinetobacter baumannii]